MKKIEKRMFGRREFVKTGVLAAGAVVASIALGGCGSPRSQETSSSAGNPTENQTTGANSSQEQSAQSGDSGSSNKALVAVFSWSGNTLQVAERIHEQVESDLFRIEPTTPYSTDYNTVLEEAQTEQRNGDLPAITSTVTGWDSYDVIYLGYPIWWYEAPQIIKSFVSQYDFTNKTVVPFCTSEGSRLESTLSGVKELCPGAEFLNGITLTGSTVSSHLGEVDSWLNGLGIE